MMKKLVSSCCWVGGIYLLAALFSCSRADRRETGRQYHFTVDVLSHHTPVRNQGRTSTCWAYASASWLESEWLRQHPADTLLLSPMFVVRQKYLRQLEAYYYSHGREEIRAGGLGHSLMRVAQEDGLMPYNVYSGLPAGQRRHNHRKLIKELRKIGEKGVRRCDWLSCKTEAEDLLDREMGVVPDSFLYRGRRYTPRSLADSLRLDLSCYQELTSFTHHPFDTRFILEVPDNWEHAAYLNLPIDTLQAFVLRTLAHGGSAVWHGDVSEECYRSAGGVADWPVRPVTQAMRQEAFERFETTDDHMMHLIGLAHDADGRQFFILKDSYGRYAPYDGWIYMSEDYFRMKTLSVMLRPEG